MWTKILRNVRVESAAVDSFDGGCDGYFKKVTSTDPWVQPVVLVIMQT